MEGYSYYLRVGDELIAMTYEDVVVGVNSGSINPNTKVLMYHNFERDKHYVKAKNVV